MSYAGLEAFLMNAGTEPFSASGYQLSQRKFILKGQAFDGDNLPHLCQGITDTTVGTTQTYIDKSNILHLSK